MLFTFAFPSSLDIRGDLIHAAIAAQFEPRKPLFSLFDIGYSALFRKAGSHTV